LSRIDESLRRYFTDFDGRLNARLSQVRFRQAVNEGTTKTASTTARYECVIKAEYHKDLMRLVEEGMLLAIRNFKSGKDGLERFTLAEVASLRPEHFGLQGLSSQTYYPMQFEIIQQSVSDWRSDDHSTMMVTVAAIPINYDLCIAEAEPHYEKGFSYPVIAEQAFVLNHELIHQMYNRRILERMNLDWRKPSLEEDPRREPRIGTVSMFEAAKEQIPIYIDFESLVRYHFGIFSFTGGGKSNLLANLIRRLVYHAKNTNIIVFDISMEYPFLLMDVFADPKVNSKIVLESDVGSADELSDSLVKPRAFESDERAIAAFSKIISLKRVDRFVKPRFQIPRFGDILSSVEDQRKESTGKQVYIEALDTIKQVVSEHMEANGFDDGTEINEQFVRLLAERSEQIVTELKVSDKSNVYAWATTRMQLLDQIERARKEQQRRGITSDRILDLLEESTRLVCVSVAEPNIIKELAIDVAERMLWRRKRRFKVEPFVLFVFDEAQEFAPSLADARGMDRDCSETVEKLLRQGRKYGLGGCLATQRIAYLNTNTLQQLHTYFVGTLPRPYDRQLVSDTFTIDLSILEKTLEFSPGEWLLSSYIATGMENVPIFIRTDDSEKAVSGFLDQF
jgi:hypothetical protein